MAIPRVFISSTCYDLKHIRENLKFFVKTIGYEPILSDEGDVFYNPYHHTHDSCLKEVETCQLFILIIGGRYGGEFKDSDKSITNSEYKEAIKHNIPIFTLVERGVYSDHHLYGRNKKDNPNYKEIIYPNIDDIRIFDFIDEVRKNIKNNAIHPFQNFSDMEKYLQKQWAGMMYDFLVEKNREKESKLTNKLLSDITLASRKTEELVKFLLKQTNHDKVAINKEIEDIDNKIEAEKFFDLIKEQFEINILPEINIEELRNKDLTNISWIEFLEFLGFYSTIVYTEEIESTVLWPPFDGIGLAIEDETEEKFEKNEKFEKLFNSYKKLDLKDKTDILNKLKDRFNKEDFISLISKK